MVCPPEGNQKKVLAHGLLGCPRNLQYVNIEANDSVQMPSVGHGRDEIIDNVS